MSPFHCTRREVLGFAAAAALAGLAPHAAFAAKRPPDDRSTFFERDAVTTLDIVLSEEAVVALGAEPRKPVKAMVVEGKRHVYEDATVHLKGAAGSFQGIDQKPGLTIGVPMAVSHRQFHGMQKFHLNNSVQDPSYLTELLCGELFRAAGVPAAMVTHARVAINGKPRGLYCLKEGYDAGFLQNNFGTRDGNFYDGGFLTDIDQPLTVVSTHGDVKDRADLKALAEASAEPDGDRRFAQLERLLDLDAFLSFLVIEVVTWDWDGYPMNRNNYRVFHHPQRDKITFLPSGMDQMFHDPGGDFRPHFEGIVAHALIKTDEGRKRYMARFAEVMKNVFDVDAQCRRLDSLQPRVQRALASIDEGAGRDYPGVIKALQDAMRERRRAIEEQMQRATRDDA